MSYQQGTLYLSATYIGAQPSPGKDEIGGGFSNNSGTGFSPSPGAMAPLYKHLTQLTVDALDATVETVLQEHKVKLQTLAQTIEDDLAAVRTEGTTHPLPPVQAIQRELQVRNTLLLRKTAEYHVQNALANAFYGADPIGRTDFFAKARRFAPVQTPDGKAVEQWTRSYKAAWSARLLHETIQRLNQQQISVQNFLAAVQTDEQARLISEQEAQRVAAELARMAAEAEARRIVVEQQVANEQRLAAEQAEAQARERARLAALAEAQRLAIEQAELAAAAAAQQLAAEQARLELLAQAQRQAETLRLEREHQQAQQRAREQARQQSPTFAQSGAMSAVGPVFTTTAGSVLANPVTTLALQNALRTAVSGALTALATSATPIIAGFAALLAPSPLGNGDLYSLSVPLSDLAPELPKNLHEAAAAQGHITLKVTLGSSTTGNQTRFVVATTDGVSVPADVPVRLAQFDSEKNLYVSSGAGPQSITLTWTPLVDVPGVVTAFPVIDTDPHIYQGAVLTPAEGRIEGFPQLDQYDFGGFVTVFPSDSGIPPIYTMFRDRRNEPGVASGAGQAVSGAWLGAASQPAGAPVPLHIAAQLKGREFKTFRAFREAFWKAIAEDALLSVQFTGLNKIGMSEGHSPFAPPSEQVGRRTKFEIHHVEQISGGGQVYDMDNLRLLTPKQHIETHSIKGGQ